jgi:SAM-dependent methyltransferase
MEDDRSGEPLAASAPLARHLARSACSPECEPYHGLIQHLRVLGVVAAPDRHAEFYGQALGAVAADGGTRVLIAGAADYGMVAQVLTAFAAAGSHPQITLIDRCRTPLLLSTWFAAERGVRIATAVADAERYVPDEPVDAVITDSLLTLLGPDGRERALGAWHDALRPGGRVVTVLRIADRPRPSGPEATEAFVRWVRARAERVGGLPDLDASELELAAHRFADAPIPLAPIRSAEELTAAVERSGLRVERLDEVELAGNAPTDAAGPGIHRAELYARIVAARP